MADAILEALDFGCVADGTSDDTAALQAALDACKDNRTLVIPNGRYRVTGPLVIRSGWQQTIRGDGLGSRLYFEGTYAEAFRCENVTNFTIRDLYLSGPPTVGRGLHVTEAGGSSTEHVLLENIYSQGFGVGVAIGADTRGDVSEVTLVHVNSPYGATAAFQVGNGEAANVLDIRFLGCTARNSAVGLLIAGGGCTWSDGAALSNSVADFQMATPPGHPVLIRGVRSEGSRRFWDYGGGHTYGTTVTIEGVFVASFDDPDGAVVTHAASTPLTMIGCTFRAAPGKGKPTAMRLGVNRDHPLPLVAINVVTDSDRPFGDPDDPAVDATILGCHTITGGGSVKVGMTNVMRGEPPAPPVRREGQATIARGKTAIVVEHGLGGQPAPEDVAVVRWPAPCVWLGAVEERTLTFRIEKPPTAGITFTWSASLR